MARSKVNPFCPVPSCKATAPHSDDPTVSGLMRVFSPPSELARWSLAAMVDLRKSMLADMEAGRHFAWQTRLRQVEEIYFKALYCAFFAIPEELPHIFSGAMPNSIMPMYRKVNEVIFEGRGQWEVAAPGQAASNTPVSMLHSAAHASYAAMFTAISYVRQPEAAGSLDRLKEHLNNYCGRLEYMHQMFAHGRDKEIVMDAFISMHRPLSYWQNRQAQQP